MLTQKQPERCAQKMSTVEYQESDGNLILWEPDREPMRVPRKPKQIPETSDSKGD
jgi:hypothetical protein